MDLHTGRGVEPRPRCRDDGGRPYSSSTKLAKIKDFEQGVAAVKAGNYERALVLLQKVVADEPKNADAWNFIGFSHRKLKHFDRALPAYDKALAIDPKHLGAIKTALLGRRCLDRLAVQHTPGRARFASGSFAIHHQHDIKNGAKQQPPNKPPEPSIHGLPRRKKNFGSMRHPQPVRAK